MEKSTGIALIALILSASSFVIVFFQYMPQITGFDTIYDHKDIAIVEHPFSATYAGEADFPPDPANFYFTIPSTDTSIVARSIIVTLDYQILNLEGRSYPIGLVKEKDQGFDPENVIAYVTIDLSEGTTGQVSMNTGFLLPSSPVEELQIQLDPYAIGHINGTITQIILR